jgi:hypothetical protein
MALNVKRVGHLKKPGRYGDGGGLLLKVTPGGAKSWQLMRCCWSDLIKIVASF